MSDTITIQAATTTQQPFGVLDPVTGHMMDPDNAAIHRAIGPDQSDPPPGRGLPGLPFLGRGFPAGPPGGNEGFPGGRGLPEGGPPNAGPGGGGNPERGLDKLVGNPPEVSTGVQARAEHFLTQWKLYVGVNISNPTIVNYYQRSMLFLTYIQGAGVSEWVSAMSKWLQVQVTQLGIRMTDRWLWDSTLQSFTRQFTDMLQQEKARMTLRQGIKMQGQDLDEYTAKFEELVRHAQYDINGPQTIDMFTRGLPATLYETIFQHDNPRTFEQWRTAVLKRQGLWFHMNARGNLDKFKSTPSQSAGGQRPFFAPPRHPDAMDVDRTRARLANVESDPAAIEAQWKEDCKRWNQNGRGRSRPPMRPRGGFLQRGARFNFDNVQCYKCQQMGHIACKCPQHPWNQPSGSRACATHDYYEQEEPIQVVRTVAARTLRSRANEYLQKMADEDNAVKDKLIRKL